MTLASFIVDNIDRIIAGWTEPDTAATPLLRSQTRQILMALAADIDTASSPSGSSTVAVIRMVLRGAPDFDLLQVGDELRAMRNSVLRLWPARDAPADGTVLSQLLAFNESVDLAFREAAALHAQRVERTRSLFLGMLGHDLRTPLSAIDMACQYLQRDDVPAERKAEAVARIGRCSETLEGMIRDVLDFARSRLGKRMSVAVKPADIGTICTAALEQVRAAHPRCDFRHEASGNLDGSADSVRLRQAVWNLLDSAAKNGARGMPILFTATGGQETILLSVKSTGPAMSADTLRTLFDPIAQLAVADANPEGNPPADLGLELFIAREIVHGHGGEIDVIALDEGGMEFRVRLPR
jgi:signal transduction histidine kinase